MGRFRVKETLKRVCRPLRDMLRPRQVIRTGTSYRGHFAVTRSLVEGLRKIQVNANYNPKSIVEVADAVIVLSGIDALRQAILWKREGRISRLLAGPNILVFPSEYPSVIAAPEVDYCITPADWVSRAYESDCPALKARCAAWPAGVDTEYWRPDVGKREAQRILVFDKQVKSPVGPVSKYIQILQRRGYDVTVIRYGSYTTDAYVDGLQHCSLMVGFVSDESQGIAWAEAWSADVPTLLWFQDHDTIAGRTVPTSTAPYLSDETGLFFSGLAEFEQVLTRWEDTKETFQPRRWVLENMSDEACARKLCRLAGLELIEPERQSGRG